MKINQPIPDEEILNTKVHDWPKLPGRKSRLWPLRYRRAIRRTRIWRKWLEAEEWWRFDYHELRALTRNERANILNIVAEKLEVKSFGEEPFRSADYVSRFSAGDSYQYHLASLFDRLHRQAAPFSSLAGTMFKHCQELANRVLARRGLNIDCAVYQVPKTGQWRSTNLSIIWACHQVQMPHDPDWDELEAKELSAALRNRQEENAKRYPRLASALSVSRYIRQILGEDSREMLALNILNETYYAYGIMHKEADKFRDTRPTPRSDRFRDAANLAAMSLRIGQMYERLDLLETKGEVIGDALVRIDNLKRRQPRMMDQGRDRAYEARSKKLWSLATQGPARKLNFVFAQLDSKRAEMLRGWAIEDGDELFKRPYRGNPGWLSHDWFLSLVRAWERDGRIGSLRMALEKSLPE